jgi:hypothetical protein
MCRTRPGEALDGGQQADRREARRGDGPSQPAAVVHRAEGAGEQEEPDDLGAGDRGHGAQDGGDRPEHRIGPVGRAREFVGGDGDDREYGRADAQEDGVHPGEALVLGVEHRDGGHDHKRRHDEREGNRDGADRAGVEVAEPHRHLRGQRARHRLPDRQRLAELVLREPAPVLDEIALHVADERDRATEPQAAELEEVAHQAAQRPRLPTGSRGRLGTDGRLLRCGRPHAGSRPSSAARLKYSYRPS